MHAGGARPNLDAATVRGFGREWGRFDQAPLDDAERRRLFDRYFRVFPWKELPARAAGFDLGCGSGRWAALAAERGVAKLHCIDASPEALEVARRTLADRPNCRVHLASVDAIPLPDASQDFGYSLGVLHHLPDPEAGLAACVRKLKPGAPFLLYVYYAMDGRPWGYRALWRTSDAARRAVSRAPFPVRYAVSQTAAALLYWPLARLSRWAERRGARVDGWPLAFYRNLSFYTMRTDALDRFGTRLERRFRRAEVEAMMRRAGLERIRFSDEAPFWCAVGHRAAGT